MGGMQDMGPVQSEKNEPVFHQAWEGRALALNLAAATLRKWNIDATRYQIELIPPAEYLRMSYYEKWFVRLAELLVKRGLITREELESGEPASGLPKATPPLSAAGVPKLLANGALASREVAELPKFNVGQQVRARNIHPLGHTRLPRYARGKMGTVDRQHGGFVFPDTNALFLGEKPQHLYSVRFTARELWGETASPRDSIYIDLWDDYLEPA
jgi:nitrile hydratase